VEQANLIDKAKWLNTLFLDAQLVTAKSDPILFQNQLLLEHCKAVSL
jgi:hypothetical protein